MDLGNGDPSTVVFGSLLFVVVGQFDNLQKWWFHGGFTGFKQHKGRKQKGH
jgi:hypothetical protein